jgi:hypothetical protein
VKKSQNRVLSYQVSNGQLVLRTKSGSFLALSPQEFQALLDSMEDIRAMMQQEMLNTNSK